MLRENEKGAAEVELPLGYVAHASPSRTRLSFPDLKGRDELIDALCAGVRQVDGVYSADGRPLTGSIIITHDGSADELFHAARKARLFDVQDVPHRMRQAEPIADALAWKDWADQSLQETVGPGVNLRAIAAFAFIAMALRQLAAGSILPPAATALWYGLSLLLAVSPEPGIYLDGDGE